MKPKKGFIHVMMNPKKWWIPLTFIFVVSFTGVGLIGFETYYEAPPIPDFVTEEGESVFSHDEILQGQAIFQRTALMDYGSMFGDGANRGPDFTAQALHLIAGFMKEYYSRAPELSKLEYLGVGEQVKRELKENRYEKTTNSAMLTPAQEYAANRMVEFYVTFFQASGQQSLKPGYLANEEEVRKLAAFFYWGAWVCSTERPGKEYSYTHNWPYDPEAGNVPEAPVVFWTIIGSLGLVIGLGIVLFYHGRLEKLSDRTFLDNSSPLLTKNGVDKFVPARRSVQLTNTSMLQFLFSFSRCSLVSLRSMIS
jgi:nitric oxide reductase subunit B